MRGEEEGERPRSWGPLSVGGEWVRSSCGQKQELGGWFGGSSAVWLGIDDPDCLAGLYSRNN